MIQFRLESGSFHDFAADLTLQDYDQGHSADLLCAGNADHSSAFDGDPAGNSDGSASQYAYHATGALSLAMNGVRRLHNSMTLQCCSKDRGLNNL